MARSMGERTVGFSPETPPMDSWAWFASPDPVSSSSSSPTSATAAVLEPGECSVLGSAACAVACRVLRAVVVCAFAAVGSVVGAVTGCVVGIGTENGMLRGAGIGAISGAVFSIEVAESSRDIWRSADSASRTVFFMMDIIMSLLSIRLVGEKVGLALESAVQSQISAISPSFSFADTSDLFETGGAGARGLPADALRLLPKMKIAEDTAVDAAGELLCCSVCLQDLQPGESARRLPSCRHVFHAPCIDRWLVRQGSCPLCRRDI